MREKFDYQEYRDKTARELKAEDDHEFRHTIVELKQGDSKYQEAKEFHELEKPKNLDRAINDFAAFADKLSKFETSEKYVAYINAQREWVKDKKTKIFQQDA